MLEASAKELLETVQRTKDVHTALLELQGAELVRTCVALANSFVSVRALRERTLYMPLRARMLCMYVPPASLTLFVSDSLRLQLSLRLADRNTSLSNIFSDLP